MKEKQILVLTALFLILGVTGCAAPEAAVPAGTGTSASPVEVQGKEINLDTVNGQLVITEPGEYTLSGTGQFGVKADVGSGSVVLHLNNVSISNPVSAGLIAESGDEMVVDLVEGTKNSISDGGDDDDHDGAVYGNIPLRFTGTGELIFCFSKFNF